jgi:hypothetical protein
MKTRLFFLLVFIVLKTISAMEPVTLISISADSSSLVHIRYTIPDKEKLSQVKLYRSYENFHALDYIDLNQYAISEFSLYLDCFKGEFIDSFAASDVRYYYYLSAKTVSGVAYKCNVDSAVIAQVILGSVCDKKFNLLIDKPHYILEARCGTRIMKRYPVNLGGNPRDRKLCQDNLTSPEGNYFIPYVRGASKFYKALGINYPNREDTSRYAEALKSHRVPCRGKKPICIGGAIQIHGGGIGYQNWTWGCIAMRNYDIDELFSLKKSLVGTPVRIVGSEIKRQAD